MSLFQSFRNLSPKTRLGVGVGFLAWGVIGLQLTDTAERTLGLEASEQDREELCRLAPRIHVVDSAPGAGDAAGGSGAGGGKKD
ncbi:hypothetical protein Micbo1qcDRAFT_162566 [Microdochium bolleyi]|uniref:Uncharacterized protein n=1 Tax=Microdochium bolleyi TaxID=196109 RepID=A0A136J5F1_9PEZI|nr:hypothetical protein Micbo1qcDRAFT_162566 [Microdochium bolleyi]